MGQRELSVEGLMGQAIAESIRDRSMELFQLCWNSFEYSGHTKEQISLQGDPELNWLKALLGELAVRDNLKLVSDFVGLDKQQEQILLEGPWQPLGREPSLLRLLDDLIQDEPNKGSLTTEEFNQMGELWLRRNGKDENELENFIDGMMLIFSKDMLRESLAKVQAPEVLRKVERVRQGITVTGLTFPEKNSWKNRASRKLLLLGDFSDQVKKAITDFDDPRFPIAKKIVQNLEENPEFTDVFFASLIVEDTQGKLNLLEWLKDLWELGETENDQWYRSFVEKLIKYDRTNRMQGMYVYQAEELKILPTVPENIKQIVGRLQALLLQAEEKIGTSDGAILVDITRENLQMMKDISGADLVDRLTLCGDCNSGETRTMAGILQLKNGEGGNKSRKLTFGILLNPDAPEYLIYLLDFDESDVDLGKRVLGLTAKILAARLDMIQPEVEAQKGEARPAQIIRENRPQRGPQGLRRMAQADGNLAAEEIVQEFSLQSRLQLNVDQNLYSRFETTQRIQIKAALKRYQDFGYGRVKWLVDGNGPNGGRLMTLSAGIGIRMIFEVADNTAVCLGVVPRKDMEKFLKKFK